MCPGDAGFGGVAQLGEHHTGSVGVKGSSPSVSTWVVLAVVASISDQGLRSLIFFCKKGGNKWAKKIKQ